MRALPNVFLLLLLCLGGTHLAPAQEERVVTFQFDDAPLPFILTEYEKLTGKRIIRDDSVTDATLSIETSILMTREEAAEFLEKSLLLNGFAFLPSGPDAVKIISAARVPRSEGAPVILHPADLPEGDRLVTYVMKLHHVAAEKVLEAFRTIAPSHPYGEISVLPDGTTLAITDNSAVIRQYIALQEFVDVPVAELVTQAFLLERADAVEVAEQLNALLGPDPSAPSSAAPPTPAVTGKESNRALPPRPRIVAIERTNKVLVLAHPSQMSYLEGLIHEFDAAAESGNYLVRALRYLPVLDFLPIARTSLNRGRGEDADASDNLADTSRTTTRPMGGYGQGPDGAGGFGAFGTSRESLGEPEDSGGPRSLVVGHTLLIADPSSNELFVSGPPEHLALVERLLDNLDKKPRQIFISTVIGQLTLDDRFQLGIDFLQTLDNFQVGGNEVALAGLYRTRRSGFIDPEKLLDAAVLGTGLPSGLTMYGQIGDHLRFVLEALEQTSRFTVLSRPSVFTLNNQKAVIQTGERIAVPVNTLSALNTGTLNPSVASTIQFQDVVLRLEVIPLINSRDEVTLQISQVNDDIVGTTVISGNEVPTIGTQEMRTTVIVPNKSTVLLGGLISQDRRESQTGLPILTRIPVIKHLTGSTVRTGVRQELLIFIQPQIVANEEDLAAAGMDTLDRTALAPVALEFATSPETPVVTPVERLPPPAPPAPSSRWRKMLR